MGIIEKIIKKIGPVSSYGVLLNHWSMMPVIVSLMVDDQELIKEYLCYLEDLYNFEFQYEDTDGTSPAYMLLTTTSAMNVKVTNLPERRKNDFTWVCVELSKEHMSEIDKFHSDLYTFVTSKKTKQLSIFKSIVNNSPNIFVNPPINIFNPLIHSTTKYEIMENYYTSLINDKISFLNKSFIYEDFGNIRFIAKKMVLHDLPESDKKFFLIMMIAKFGGIYDFSREVDISLIKDITRAGNISYNEKLYVAYKGVYFKLKIIDSAGRVDTIKMLGDKVWNDTLFNNIEVHDVMNYFAPSIMWQYFNLISTYDNIPYIHFDSEKAVQSNSIVIIQKNNMKLIFFINEYNGKWIALDRCAFIKIFSGINQFKILKIESDIQQSIKKYDVDYFVDKFDISKVVFNCDLSGKGIEYYKQFGVNISPGEHNETV